MAAPRKLSAFRQLSLDCDRRPRLVRRPSEEEGRRRVAPWSAAPRGGALIKVAWEDEPVIVRRCAPMTRDAASCASSEAEAPPPVPPPPSHEKTNIEIYLARDAKTPTPAAHEEADPPDSVAEAAPRPPLARERRDAPAAPPRGRLLESNALVVVPVACDEPAAARRRRFQKRTGSALVVDDSGPTRPPLVRSSSAPAHRPRPRRRPPAARRAAAAARRAADGPEEGEPRGGDVVTMVSLVSPEGSEAEEEEGTEERVAVVEERREAEQAAAAAAAPKVMSLRKTVKSVSFQQSSIHAVRSFSASFPARRASLIFGGVLKTTNKSQEKRSTQHACPDDDERVPKRRLVKCQQVAHDSGEEDPENPTKFAVSVTAKEEKEEEEERAEREAGEGVGVKTPVNDEDDDNDAKSQKEQQCWSLYRKMTEKGINVSFDTILRGMLTPTEYRISKKHHQHLHQHYHQHHHHSEQGDP